MNSMHIPTERTDAFFGALLEALLLKQYVVTIELSGLKSGYELNIKESGSKRCVTSYLAFDEINSIKRHVASLVILELESIGRQMKLQDEEGKRKGLNIAIISDGIDEAMWGEVADPAAPSTKKKRVMKKVAKKKASPAKQTPKKAPKKKLDRSAIAKKAAATRKANALKKKLAEEAGVDAENVLS